MPPPERPSPYRVEGGQHLIEVKLREVRQLFDTLDPAPFHEKDLSDDADAYIVGAAREIGVGRPLKLVIHLPAEAAAGDAPQSLPDAVHHYFAYRAELAGRQLAQTLRQGAVSFAIGFAFLMACLLLRQGLESPAAGPLAEILAEGLLIMGWVAMWRPIEIFLYDWWPILGSARVLRRLADIPIEVRPLEGRPGGTFPAAPPAW